MTILNIIKSSKQVFNGNWLNGNDDLLPFAEADLGLLVLGVVARHNFLSKV